MPLARKNYIPQDDTVYEDPTPAIAPRAGWDAADEVAKKVKKSGSVFIFDEDPHLVSFVVGYPIDSYLVHWVDTKDGRRSFRCLDDDPDECPLCDIGDSPQARSAFWLVDFSEEKPTPKVLEATNRVRNMLKGINSDMRKGGPLEGNFFSAHRTGSGNTTQTFINRVKDRDLEEDWDVSLDGARELLDTLSKEEPPRLYIAPRDALVEAANTLKRKG